MGVELFKSDAIAVVATDGMDDLEELGLFEAVAEFVVDLLHVLEGNLAFALVVDEVESASTSIFREGSSLG